MNYLSKNRTYKEKHDADIGWDAMCFDCWIW
jgi:hypothetical protein